MNLNYLARVTRARGVIVLIATLSAFAGGVAVLMTTEPRYDATAKVELTYIRPDPITGFTVQGRTKSIMAYIDSEMHEIKSFPVAGRAVENLGWLDSPDLQDTYASLPHGAAEDYQHWVAKRVIDGTSVRPVADSNLLEIRFRAVSPQIAKIVVSAVREAYQQDSSAMTAANARGTLPAFTNQIADAQAKIAQLELDKAALERSSGVIIQNDKGDLDSIRLKALATTVTPPVVTAQNPNASRAERQLAQLDLAISGATRAMGPNNPALISLQQRRQIVAAEVAREHSAKDAVTTAVQGEARIVAGQTATQMSKVISQRDALMKLHLIQDAIEAQHGRYAASSKRATELQAMVNGGGGDVLPIGPVDAPNEPAYPNKPLIIGGATGLGLVLGVLLAAMAELWKRRVRTEQELRVVAPGLAIISIPDAMLSRRRDRPRRRREKAPRLATGAQVAAE